LQLFYILWNSQTSNRASLILYNELNFTDFLILHPPTHPYCPMSDRKTWCSKIKFKSSDKNTFLQEYQLAFVYLFVWHEIKNIDETASSSKSVTDQHLSSKGELAIETMRHCSQGPLQSAIQNVKNGLLKRILRAFWFFFVWMVAEAFWSQSASAKIWDPHASVH
jgi:hypothetical protein